MAIYRMGSRGSWTGIFYLGKESVTNGATPCCFLRMGVSTWYSLSTSDWATLSVPCTMSNGLRSAHTIHCTADCTLPTAHWTMQNTGYGMTAHCTQQNASCKVKTFYHTLHTAYWKRCNAYYTQYTAQSTLHYENCTPCTKVLYCVK